MNIKSNIHVNINHYTLFTILQVLQFSPAIQIMSCHDGYFSPSPWSFPNYYPCVLSPSNSTHDIYRFVPL